MTRGASKPQVDGRMGMIGMRTECPGLGCKYQPDPLVAVEPVQSNQCFGRSIVSLREL